MLRSFIVNMLADAIVKSTGEDRLSVKSFLASLSEAQLDGLSEQYLE